MAAEAPANSDSAENAAEKVAKHVDEDEDGDEFWRHGSEYIGRRVRRAVMDESGTTVVGAADGVIIGWLPESVSDYVSEITSEPAALWHLVYDEAVVGEEDLEEFEVQDGIESYTRDAWANLGDNAATRQARREADSELRAAQQARLQLEEFLRAKEEAALGRDDGPVMGDECAPEVIGTTVNREIDQKTCELSQVGGKRSRDEQRHACLPQAHATQFDETGLRKRTKTFTEMPKRPLNAFTLWFNVMLKGMQQERPGLSRAEYMSIGGERWRELSEQLKDVYKRKHEELEDAWLEAARAFRARLKQDPSLGREARLEEREGQRPRGGGFFVFSAQKREAVKQSNPGANMSHIAKLLGEMWRALTPEEKASYVPKPGRDRHSGVLARSMERGRGRGVTTIVTTREGNGLHSKTGQGRGRSKGKGVQALPRSEGFVSPNDQELSEGKEGREEGRSRKSKKRGGKYPDVVPWFALVADADEDAGVGTCRLLEVQSGVYRDGTCKAREFLRMGDGRCEDGNETLIGPQSKCGDASTRFVAASRFPKMVALPERGWIPVRAVRLGSESEGCGAVVSASVETQELAEVAVVGAVKLEMEVARQLLAPVEARPFPVSRPPSPVTPTLLASPQCSPTALVANSPNSPKHLQHDAEPKVSRGNNTSSGSGMLNQGGHEGVGVDQGMVPIVQGSVFPALQSSNLHTGLSNQMHYSNGGPTLQEGSQTSQGAHVESTTPAHSGARRSEGHDTWLSQVQGACDAVAELIRAENCAPLMLRLAWADSGSFQGFEDGKGTAERNQCPFANAARVRAGGANGSIRFGEELDYPCNKGLALAVSLLQPIADRFEQVSAADLFQIAGALAVHESGGPWVPLHVGRLEVQDTDGEGVSEDASRRRSCVRPPFPHNATSAGAYLRAFFGSLGFKESEAVALMGAHTLGRAHLSRSGLGPASTPYTKAGPGRTKGGGSWTEEWLVFDNSYFTALTMENRDPHLIRLQTDQALVDDPLLRPHALRFANDQVAFFQEYAAAHCKMSSLGASFDPPEGVLLPRPQ